MKTPPFSSCSRSSGPPSPSRQRIRPVLPCVMLPLSGLTCWPFSSQLWTACAGRQAAAQANATAGARVRRIATIVPPPRSDPSAQPRPCASRRPGLGLQQLLGNEPAQQHVVHAQPEARLGLDAEHHFLVVLERQPL